MVGIYKKETQEQGEWRMDRKLKKNFDMSNKNIVIKALELFSLRKICHDWNRWKSEKRKKRG